MQYLPDVSGKKCLGCVSINSIEDYLLTNTNGGNVALMKNKPGYEWMVNGKKDINGIDNGEDGNR